MPEPSSSRDVSDDQQTSLVHGDGVVRAVADHEGWSSGQWRAWDRIRRDAETLIASGDISDLFIIGDGTIAGVTGVSAHPMGTISAVVAGESAGVLKAASAVIRSLKGREPEVDEERVEEIRSLFAAQGYKMAGPRRDGDRKDLSGSVRWSAPYVAADVSGGAVGAGRGGTPIEAAENAWAEFQSQAGQRT